MRKVRGFTLIELVIVIIVLGILSAIVIPKYIDLKTSATNAAKAGMSGGIMGALAISIADLKTPPSLTQLLTYISGTNISIASDNSGIQVVINANNYTVPTYTGATCTGATTNASDIVQCVGFIP